VSVITDGLECQPRPTPLTFTDRYRLRLRFGAMPPETRDAGGPWRWCCAASECVFQRSMRPPQRDSLFRAFALALSLYLYLVVS
jgi:hypothetical protein